jgi:hypothetical protein
VSDTVTLEYLSTSDPDRRRAPYVVAGVIGLLVLLGAGFLWWSDSVRTSTNVALASAFRESVDSAAAGESLVQATLAYASPMIWSTSVPEDVRSDLRALVEASAADVSGRLGLLRERVAGTTVLPWHGPQAAARAELLALLDAQRARFDGIANDASDIDLILADGPLPVGAATEALRAADAD